MLNQGLPFDIVFAIASAVVPACPSEYIMVNSKTVISVDFGICGLMHKGNNGLYKSETCKGCYSMTLLNHRKGLRERLETLPPCNEPGQLEAFEDSMQMLKEYVPGLERLRFYSFADFKPDHMPFIKVAAKYFEVHIISKALSFPNNEKHLRELLTMENVWLSLSFNKDFTRFMERIAGIVKDADRANLNYTLNFNEENPDELPFRHLISVWHLKNDRKRWIVDQGRFEALTELNTCGMFNADGSRVTYEWTEKANGKRIKETKGSCHSCNNCNCSLKDLLAGRGASLPEKLAA